MPDKDNSLKAVREAVERLGDLNNRLPDLLASASIQKVAETLANQRRPRWQQELQKPEPPKRKHKPHRQYQRERVRTVLNQVPNWHELSDNDLVEAVRNALPKKGKFDPEPPGRKSILREAGRLK